MKSADPLRRDAALTFADAFGVKSANPLRRDAALTFANAFGVTLS